MKIIKNILQTIFGLLILLSNTEVWAQKKVLMDTKKTFEGIQRIEVSSGMLEMEYIGNPNKKDVNVDAYLESSQGNQNIIFIAVGDVLKITYPQSTSGSKYWRESQTKGHIKISGPEQIQLDLIGGSGSMKVDRLIAAHTKIRVGSGIIDISNVTGTLEVKASSGRININGLNGSLKMSFSSGSALLSHVNGLADLTLSSGSVKGDDITGPLSLSLSSGSAKLSRVSQVESVKVTSGSAEFTQSGLADLTNLRSSSGSIRIKTTSKLQDYNYNLNASSGTLRVGNNSKGKTLQINNGSLKIVNGTVSSGSILIDN
jgi:hypothetical protein